MSDIEPCPSCCAAVSSQSGARVFFQCGSHSEGPYYTYTSDLCDVRRELNAANTRITTIQTQLDQRWEMMRALEVECGTKDVAEAVKFIRGLKARVSELLKAGDVMQKALIGTEGQSHWQSLAEAHLADLIWRKAKGDK